MSFLHCELAAEWFSFRIQCPSVSHLPTPERSLWIRILYKCSHYSFSLPPSFAYPKHKGAEFCTLEKLLMLERAFFLGKMVIICMLQFYQHSRYFQHALPQKAWYPTFSGLFPFLYLPPGNPWKTQALESKFVSHWHLRVWISVIEKSSSSTENIFRIGS